MARFSNRVFRNLLSSCSMYGRILSFATLIFSTGCVGGLFGGGSSGNSGPVSVAISPLSASVPAGGSQQFTALIRGTSNTAVQWRATSGTIDNTGLFTAPASASKAPVVVTAVSSADSTAQAMASVTLNSSLIIVTRSVPDALLFDSYTAGLSALGGKPPYSWNISSGIVPGGLQLDRTAGSLSGTPSQLGNFSFVVKVSDAEGKTASQDFSLSVSQSTGFDGPAELPRVYVASDVANTPAPGTTIAVPAGGNLQAALNAANCGDTITLQAGAIYSGTYIFPNKPCDDSNWIIVRTSAPDTSLPPEGTRMTPCFAGVTSILGRPILNCAATSKVLATISYPISGVGPIVFATGANHYRLLGLEITRAQNTSSVDALITPILDGTADKLIFDRLWVHGDKLADTRRGMWLGGSTNVAVIDSYFNDFHCVAVTGSCTDSQAISGGLGSDPMGPYKIVNNFLEAAGENVLFGGGAATQTPADIEVRQNHFYKPMIWMAGQPGFIGATFVVKNHFEVKNAQRVLLDSNVMENTWGGFSQSGFSVLLTPKNQGVNGLNVCPLCQVTDVTIRNSTISNVGSVFQIANIRSGADGLPLDGERYSIHDVIADSVRGAALGGAGVFAEVESRPTPILQHVMIKHITAFAPKMMFAVSADISNPILDFVFTDSIVLAGQQPIWSSGTFGTSDCAYHDVPVTTVRACFPGPSFARNVIIAPSSNYPPSTWPTGNMFPTSAAIVRFSNFNGGSGGNYELLSTSPYITGSDGLPLGADITGVLKLVAAAR